MTLIWICGAWLLGIFVADQAGLPALPLGIVAGAACLLALLWRRSAMVRTQLGRLKPGERLLHTSVTRPVLIATPYPGFLIGEEPRALIRHLALQEQTPEAKPTTDRRGWEDDA